jgi:hypothetical protein
MTESHHHTCELHDIFLRRWLVHVAYCVDLDGVSFNASVSDPKAQKQSKRYTEDALGRVELPLELSQVGEGLSKVGNESFLFSSLDNHIST